MKLITVDRISAKCIYPFCSFLSAHKPRAHTEEGSSEKKKRRTPSLVDKHSASPTEASEVNAVRLQPPHIKQSSHISFSHTEISLLRTLNFTWHLSFCTHSLSAIKQASQPRLWDAGRAGLKQAAAFSWAPNTIPWHRRAHSCIPELRFWLNGNRTAH